jgi:hypothetical protein
MLTAIRAYLLQHTADLRESCRDIYRHYKLERDKAERASFTLRSHDDQIILEAIARAKEAQYRQTEQQVRRLHEMSRFVTRDKDRG